MRKESFGNSTALTLMWKSLFLLAGAAFIFSLAYPSEPATAQGPANPPVGTIMAWAGQKNRLPTNGNWRVCNGDELDRNQFPELFNAIGTVWGGTGTPRFKLPNLRGRFLRGVDEGAGLDPGDNRSPSGTASANDVGSVQPEDFKSHRHSITDPGHDHRVYWHNFISAQDGTYERSNTAGGDPKPLTTKNTTGITINDSGGQETRPDNAYIYWIIRVR